MELFITKDKTMTQAVEKEIQKMLSTGQTPSSIAKHLLRKKNLSRNTDDFLAVCRFMYQSGLYQLLIQTAISRLKKKEVVPWAFIIEILSSQKVKLPKGKRAFFIEGIIEQDQISSILTSCSWDKTHPELVNMKREAIEQINREKNHTFIKLMEDLEFIQAQGVLKKEEEILKKLKEIDPENPDINEKWLQFREKWGRNIIHQRKTHSLTKHRTASPPSEKERKQVEKIAKSVKTILKKTPEKSYDMALFFSFVGYPYLAIQILKDHMDNVSSEWLYLDLLLQSNLYLDCLSFLDIMEVKYSDDPETIFALIYLRAKAYHGLGKKKKAKDILSDLLKVRPNYRLTHYLLNQWEKGTSELD